MSSSNKMQRIKKVLLDPCFISAAFFTIWMGCFDYQNVFAQYSLYEKVQRLEADCVRYTSLAQKIKKENKERINNNDLLEKFAREKYYMKREQEDLYVIIQE